MQKKKAKAEKTSSRDLAALAGVSDTAVRDKTGCDWARWVEHLDRQGAAAMSHREIAEYVQRQFDISGWWAQTVTVGYERIKGLRAIGQRRGGSYEANKSKTFGVPLAELFRACHDARTRRRWLPDAPLRVRKSTPEKSLRITWEDETSVEFYFTAKGPAKSQLAIQHRQLSSQADADSKKQFWSERLAALANILLKPSGHRGG